MWLLVYTIIVEASESQIDVFRLLVLISLLFLFGGKSLVKVFSKSMKCFLGTVLLHVSFLGLMSSR